MTIDDHLGTQLRHDALSYPADPPAELRARTLAAIANEPSRHVFPWRRAAGIAAVLTVASALAWWGASATAPSAAIPSATPWVVEMVDTPAPAVERGPVTPIYEPPRVIADAPSSASWMSGATSRWSTVMFHPFEDEWQRMKADFTRAGSLVWMRVARPLAAVFWRRNGL